MSSAVLTALLVSAFLVPTAAFGETSSGDLGSVSVGLAGSLATPEGTWTLVPMQSFWELFLLPNGGSAWSLQTPPGVADNGGLVLSGGAPGRLVVGFRPSQNLKYSPLATTDDSARTWTAGIFPHALAPVPDALAASGNGSLTALSQGPGDEVWASAGAGPNWTRVTTLAAITRSAGHQSCEPAALTAVAFTVAGTPLVGADCRRPGVAGIVALTTSGPRLSAPELPPALKADTISTLRLATTPEGVVGLLLARHDSRTTLLAVWQQPDGSWSLSPSLPVGRASVASTLIGPDLSVGALVQSAGSHPVPEMIQGPGSGWQRLPPAPTSARVVSVSPAGEVDAFGTKGDELDVWRLLPGDPSWTASQTLKVPVQTGSSH